MPKIQSLLSATAILAILGLSCQKNISKNNNDGNFDRPSTATTPDLRPVPSRQYDIPNIISSDRTLSRDTLWFLSGPTYVTNNATLTIESGTFIKGKLASSTPNNFPSLLVITRGAKIIADGTTAAPIVFTSSKMAHTRWKNDWGGVVILGRGTTNVGVARMMGLPDAYATSLGLDPAIVHNYGNVSDNDNSGIIRNVRIEFGGNVVSQENALGGLTMGAVGYNTILENVQVSISADDGFKFFGGAVNGKRLITLGCDDDDFDFDQGYVGTIQFAAGIKIPDSGVSASPNGVESNNTTPPIVPGGPFASKLTNPTLVNITLLGRNISSLPNLNTGLLFRENSAYQVRNFIVGGFNRAVNVTPGSISYGLAHGFLSVGSGFTNTTTSVASNTNLFLRLSDPFSASYPDLRYTTASLAPTIYSFVGLTVPFPGGVFPTSSSLDNTAQYSGAFGPANASLPRWDEPWSSYSPDSNPYL